MNKLLKRLSEAMENMLDIMQHRNEIEDKERRAHLALLDKKYELLQWKFERMQVIMEFELIVLDIRLKKTKADFSRGTKIYQGDLNTSEEPPRKKTRSAQNKKCRLRTMLPNS